MKTQLPYETRKKLDELLTNVGDMSLKRRAYKIIEGLELKRGDQIVDLGCGDGFFLYIFSNLPLNLKLLGFDNDKRVLENARKNLSSKKIKLITGSITKMPFKNNCFKKIIMTEVLEHIAEDKKALSEVYRVLKPGGIFILTVPNYNFPFLWDPINWLLQNLLDLHIGGTGFFAGIWARHIRLYRKEKIEKLINNVGFKIESVQDLTTRCLPFNHYLVNLVARLLYDIKPSFRIIESLSKFKNVKKPLLINLAFSYVNNFDKLNNIFPGKNGLNIYVKVRK